MANEVVHCSECGKPIKSVPIWLYDVNVEFTCEACRQKHPKPIAEYDPIPAAKPAAYSDDDSEAPEEEMDDEDMIDADMSVSSSIDE